MAMTDKAIAKKIVPKVINHIVPKDMPEETVKNLIQAVAEGIVAYGYKKQELVTLSTIAVCHEFGDISVKFFKILNETIQMSMQLNSHRYNKIIDFIMINEETSLSEKIDLFLKIEEARGKKVKLVFGGIIAVVAIFAIQIIVNKIIEEKGKTMRDRNYNRTKRTKFRERGRTERRKMKYNG